MAADLATLWIGSELSNLEKLCATSIIQTGNRLTIYSYDELKGVPEGVEIKDARKVLNTRRILRYGGEGSPAIHANLFRYAMLNQTGQIWVDLDVLALRKFEFDSDYIFGFEVGRQVNNAVLGLPKSSLTLKKLSNFNENSFGFPKAGNVKRRLEWMWTMRFKPASIEYWPWGCTGPRAVTHYLRRTGEIKHVMPQSAFYPVPWSELSHLIKPRELDLGSFGPETYAIHLWAAGLKHKISETGGEIPGDSLLGEVLQKYGFELRI